MKLKIQLLGIDPDLDEIFKGLQSGESIIAQIYPDGMIIRSLSKEHAIELATLFHKIGIRESVKIDFAATLAERLAE